MMRILHVSADYPDAFSQRKTLAVRNLLAGTPEFDHHVYAINRQNGLSGVRMLDKTGDITTLVYRAPTYGILLETFLNKVADWIIADCRERNLEIDLVHAHKLTIEGVAARRIANALGCPYVCTVRGNTDQKYLRLKLEKRQLYRDVARQAAHLFPVTPWIERYLVETLSPETVPRTLLPTITGIEGFIVPSDAGTRFVTAFHLDNWRLKGLPNLLSAIAAARAKGTDIWLDIIGVGSKRETDKIKDEIRRHGLTEQVSLVGSVPHENMPETLNRYAAFVLPTLRETFGMVYLEALFSGVPILYSQDRGIDGFFDDRHIGIRCNPGSVASITSGLIELRSQAAAMKQEISNLQGNGYFRRFSGNAICADYRAVIRKLCSPARPDVTVTKDARL